MPAYSFGNRWVGIVSLKDPPAAEPLHRMALRLRHQLRSRRVRIASDLELTPAQLNDLVGLVRHRRALREEWVLVHECLETERAIRLGSQLRMRPWLRAAVHREHDRAAERGMTFSASSNRPASIEHQDTNWASLVPVAPDVPGLPPLSSGLAAWADRHIGPMNDNAERWLRWASLHSSYLNETRGCAQIVGPGTLLLLERLGGAWNQVVLLERLRRSRGEFTSNSEMSQALGVTEQVRTAAGAWITDLDAVHLGRGEEAELRSGGPSRAAAAVGMQVLGAATLLSGRCDGLRAVVDSIRIEEADSANWPELLSKTCRGVDYRTIREGPDHAPIFTVTATDGRRSAAKKGHSVKNAKRAAAKEFLRRYAPQETARSDSRRRVPTPRPYVRPDDDHADTVRHVRRTFVAVDPALATQALTHRSWEYENKVEAAGAGQRSYGVLAREGADILTALVHHQNVVATLARTLTPTPDEARLPAVERVDVSELFDDLRLGAGVLLGNGAGLETVIKADVVQAVIAAAWRGDPGGLMRHQPRALSLWSTSLRGGLDPATQLEQLCSSIRLDSRVLFVGDGPDHRRTFRATYEFAIDGSPSWIGPWQSTKTAAKKAAAGQILDLLVSGTTADGGTRELLSAFLLAEIRCAEPAGTVVEREIAARRLAVDRLAAGAWHDYAAWAASRGTLIADSGAAQQRIGSYYLHVLTRSRQERVASFLVSARPRIADSIDGPAVLSTWVRRGGPEPLHVLYDVLTGLSSETPHLRAVVRAWSTTTVAAHLIELPEDADNPVLAAGSSAVLNLVLRYAAAVSESTGVAVEVRTTGSDDSHTVVALRMSGIDLEGTLHQVLDIAEIVVAGASGRFTDGALMLLLPVLPPQPWTSLVRAAADAAARSCEDSWLAHTGTRIGRVLAAVAPLTEDDLQDADAVALAACETVLHEMARSG